MVHALAGKRQSPEHVKKRTEAMMAARASWTEDQKRAYAKKVSELNLKRNAAEKLKKFQMQVGSTPWNKGNNWKDGVSPEQVRAVIAERARKRRANSQKLKINDRISSLIRQNLKLKGGNKQGRSWPTFLPYDYETLVAHLKSTIPSGYAWGDYLTGALQLDHIIPTSVHNFQSVDDIDFQKCWSLSNLQLLPASVNNCKKDKLFEPFQPSLALCV